MEAFLKNSAAKWFQQFNLRNQCQDSLQDGTVTCCLQDKSSECQMKSVGKAPPDGQTLQP